MVGVRARTKNFSGHEGIEDLATVSLSFDSGAEAHLTSVWHNILSRGSTRRLELFCQDGMVWLDDEFRGPLHIETSDGTEIRPCPSPAWVEDLPLESRRGRLGRALLRRGRPGLRRRRGWRTQPPEPSLDDALVAHRLVDASYRSADAGGVPIALG